jgi:tryptophan synthase alpha chain
MQLLQSVFTQCRSSERPAFIPFLTAGDPTLEATGAFVKTLVDAGADAIEIGFPYSDPLADGPVIQASYSRSLAWGTKLDAIFAAAAQWTKRFPETPFLAMVSYSLIYRRSVAAFLDACREAGFTGFVVPDLPHEESNTLLEHAQSRGLALIRLVTPTTPLERSAEIARVTTGFLYVVSITGITGARAALPAELKEQLANLRMITSLPLCVGFGISTVEQVQSLRGIADGVIIGSTIVRCLEGDGPVEEKQRRLHELAQRLANATR